LQEIDKCNEARRRGWEDLVINEGYSQLLLSLVDNHTSAYDLRRRTNAAGHGLSSAQIDLIKGKGRGLIILLHGPPGTGKTSTAESIAAYTGRPLYAITCGDIGVTASEVDENLRIHTERAQRWGCVLLLDEADVFLARRTWDDVGRNAMVSGKTTFLWR
jgi:SpoVK/Ycf46/Vps4 family AAA+-type ATPase